MQSAQTVGIDLPLKALVWEDAEGQVWLSYNDPAWVARRHVGAAGMETAVRTMTSAQLPEDWCSPRWVNRHLRYRTGEPC
jgi:uncharacterized protein (DUF302 family)